MFIYISLSISFLIQRTGNVKKLFMRFVMCQGKKKCRMRNVGKTQNKQLKSAIEWKFFLLGENLKQNVCQECKMLFKQGTGWWQWWWLWRHGVRCKWDTTRIGGAPNLTRLWNFKAHQRDEKMLSMNDNLENNFFLWFWIFLVSRKGSFMNKIFADSISNISILNSFHLFNIPSYNWLQKHKFKLVY